MHSRLTALRQELKTLNIGGFLQPTTDEYLNTSPLPYAKRILWLCGFKGSMGTLIVLEHRAALFVDSRYTLQAQNEAGALGIDIEPYGFQSIKAWLLKDQVEPFTIGIDPWVLSYADYQELSRVFQGTPIQVTSLKKNPIDKIWQNQPPKIKNTVSIYEIEYAGESHQNKISKIAQILKTQDKDYLFLSNFDSIAWLLNLRGTDTPYLPFFLSYLLMDQNGNVILFADPQKFSAATLRALGPTITVVDENLVETHLIEIGRQEKTLWGPASTTPYQVTCLLEDNGGTLYTASDPCQLPKALKNSTELDWMRKGHIQDGIALVKFLAFLEEHLQDETHTEFSLATQLTQLRKENPLCLDCSFFPISAVGPNSALPHYKPSSETCLPIKSSEIYLIDSGGQYKGATTDITRVLALGGTPTAYQKEIYTLVLKGHIAIAQAKFPKGTTGGQLDTLARSALWQRGLNYGHGTGHGVGCYLGVHEGPQAISPRNTTPLEVGMILSNEPGCYLAEQFGVRIENLIIVRQCPMTEPQEEMLEFETISLVPLDSNLIDCNLLQSHEIQWVNDYHAQVYKSLSPYLSSSLQQWLKNKTKPL